MPVKTPAGLRAAVARLDPVTALAKFDREWATATAETARTYDLSPVRGFTEGWWLWVALARFPERLSRFRACEETVARAEDRAVRRAASAEIARLMEEAAQEAGAAEPAG